jgi:hypothetical protein
MAIVVVSKSASQNDFKVLMFSAEIKYTYHKIYHLVRLSAELRAINTLTLLCRHLIVLSQNVLIFPN